MSNEPDYFIAQVGKAMFGERWQTDISRLLGVSDRTVRRWAAGDAVPEGIWRELDQAMKARFKTFIRAHRAMQAYLRAAPVEPDRPITIQEALRQPLRPRR